MGSLRAALSALVVMVTQPCLLSMNCASLINQASGTEIEPTVDQVAPPSSDLWINRGSMLMAWFKSVNSTRLKPVGRSVPRIQVRPPSSVRNSLRATVLHLAAHAPPDVHALPSSTERTITPSFAENSAAVFVTMLQPQRGHPRSAE